MSKLFNKLVLAALVITAGCGQSLSRAGVASQTQSSETVEVANELKNGTPAYPVTNPAVLQNAFNQRTSNLQVLVFGRVISVLSDDVVGSRHQRFILQLPNSQTLLIAHNIDIAPRVEGLRAGDQLYVYGEYEWNSQGGVIHWTHRDPNRRHVGGWIEKNGVRFQ